MSVKNSTPVYYYSFFQRSHAVSWLPNEGEYKFTSNFLFVDEETEDAQDKRNEELMEITGEINYLLEQNKLPSYEKKRLVALEDFRTCPVLG